MSPAELTIILAATLLDIFIWFTVIEDYYRNEPDFQKSLSQEELAEIVLLDMGTPL